MNPVIQEEPTGCAIASVAALAGVSYAAAKAAATRLEISTEDPALWHATRHIRALLAHFGLRAGPTEEVFTSWQRLPNQALLAIKWHVERSGPAWHWVVFVREGDCACVLDPKKSLRVNRRTDFGRMQPKWFIEIKTIARK